MKMVKWAAGIGIAFVAALIVVAATTSPEKSRALAKKAEGERMCDQMMSDSALGDERRRTRNMCDQLLRRLDIEARDAK